MSTKGKTWKWRRDAKRKWSWSDEARKNHWSFKYEGADKRILKYFKWMWGRCIKANRKCDFPRTQEGFDAFCKELGPIPEDMKRPSVGRRFHDKGYVVGNIVWERYEYNVWKKRRTEQEVHNSEKENTDDIPF